MGNQDFFPVGKTIRFLKIQCFNKGICSDLFEVSFNRLGFILGIS